MRSTSWVNEVGFSSRAFVLLPLLSALLASVCLGQTQSRLTGLATDNSGAVIVGATVVARNVSTGVVNEVVTNESGNYLFPFLAPGEYEATCEMQGFKKVVHGGIVLETGSTRTVDLQLEIGEVTETVEVRGSPPLLESETSTVGQFIERATVFGMPLESRRAGGLVRLLGTVVFNQASGDTPFFSMGGGRSRNQMWYLDGGVAQNVALGAAHLALNPPAESLQEFKAQINNYSAEFGRTANGLILMTTRTGTNEFHGAAYEFLRNEALDTRTFFAARKAPLRYNIFGGSFGGPIRRDRTFFFANYEGARRRAGVALSNTIVPHPAELRGDFSARRDLTMIVDPITRQPFPGKIIPQNRIDPVAARFAALYPAPNVPGNDITLAPRNNYVVSLSDKLTQDFGTLKVDHVIGANDRAYIRYSTQSAPQNIASIFPNRFADSRANIVESKIHNLVGNWIHDFGPTVINEARYTYTTRRFINRAAGMGSGKNGEFGLKGVNPDAFATLRVTGLTGLGYNQDERISTPVVTHQAVNNITLIRGKHAMKAGFEFRYSRFADQFNRAGGSFTFSDRATGSGLATLLLGWTTSAFTEHTDVLDIRTDYYGLFVQDDWKVSKNLTLNLGIRWELDTPRWERIDNRQSGFDTTALNPVAGVPGVVTFPGRDGRSKYAHDFDTNNFSPRFGFAWKTWRGFLVRGGYGLSYNGEYASTASFFLTSGFSLSGRFESPDGGFTPAFLFRDGMPGVVREPLGPSFGAVSVGQAPRLAPDFFLKNHVSGYAHQYNLTIQKQLYGTLLFEAAYLANLGHKLGGAWPGVSMNMIPLVNGRGPARQDQLLRPFPHFSDVTLLVPPWGNSSYHALNLKLEKRYSSGLNFMMNYTWSKFIDDIAADDEVGGRAGRGSYTHVELRRPDKSNSGNDIRHRYIASGVYELPFGSGKPFRISNAVLNGVAGGWSLGAIAELRGGAPYGVIEQTNTSNTFSHSQRPNLLCNPEIGGGRSRGDIVARYFSTECFQAPGSGNFGNAARNVGFGPGLIGVDLSVSKRWALTERWGLLFRSDFYNLPNRPNFGLPSVLRGQGDFGRVTSTVGSGRQIQFSMRLEF